MRFVSTVAVVSATLLAGSMALAGAGREVRGTVTRVDATTHTLVIKEMAAPRNEFQLMLDNAAQITQNGKPASAGDLKTGERVKVTYSDQGSTHQATRVEILPAKAAKS
jgi:3-dehydroquinate synthase class II